MNLLPDPIRMTHIGSIIVTLLSGVAVMFLRLRASNRPITMRKIIIPPIGMSTGFLMFAVPETRIPWSWALAAFAVGAILFAYPLIRTSKLERAGRDDCPQALQAVYPYPACPAARKAAAA